MKIKELIAELLKENSLEDEIIVSYWDRNYFLNSGASFRLEDFQKAWKDFVSQGQETLEGHLEFTQTGYELVEELEEFINESKDGEDDE
jgi:hypothetical protein